MDGRHLALIGMAGVGKSTIARRVAARLGRDSVDLDAEIMTMSGSTVSEIFARGGETEFRAIEADALSDVLGRKDPVVIATGGGVVLTGENRRLLETHALTVWLRAELDVLVGRVERSAVARPLLGGDVAANMARLVAEREPLYAATADVVVDVGTLGIEDVVERVMEALS